MVRIQLTLSHLDTLDDVLDIMPELPQHYTRGIDMLVVQSLQRIIYNKKLDTDKYYESQTAPI